MGWDVDTIFFLNLHFFEPNLRHFRKMYTNSHKVGAGGQKHYKHP